MFVIIHMVGNLQIYLGPAVLNQYAQLLKGMKFLLWVARFGLLSLFTIHLIMAVELARRNRQSRGGVYHVQDNCRTSLASRTMLSSGLVILTFLIYHLLHFTLGVTDPENHLLRDVAGRHDVYSMVIRGFRNPYISGSYIVAMLFLSLHLSHAAASIFQTFGIVRDGNRRYLAVFGLMIAGAVLAGNASIPIAVMLGILGLPTEGAPQ